MLSIEIPPTSKVFGAAYLSLAEQSVTSEKTNNVKFCFVIAQKCDVNYICAAKGVFISSAIA